MADFIKLSDNCYLSATGKLVSEVHLPYGMHSIHVPPYLPITQKSVIVSMNLKQQNDNMRYYSPVSEFTLGMCRFKFYDRHTIGISFVNEWEKARHELQSKLINLNITDDLRLNARTTFSLDTKQAESVINCPAEEIVPITDLGAYQIKYRSIRGKERTCCLSYGMNFKKFPLKFKGKDLSMKSNIFFLGTYGVLFDSKMRLSAIVTFEKYNNLYADINEVLYIASHSFYKAIILAIQVL